jgi:glycosyltransferase involved in cell wall biosynthesis
LIERDLETLSHQLEMLHSIDRAFDTEPRVPELPPSEVPERPLSILFASWNVPCRRHGGGVWMTHLLEHLSRRHEITVVYCYSPEEEGWAEDIRPYARRLIGIPRRYRRTPSHEYDPLFDNLYSEYVAELRATLELEIRSGRYDLVDYQYVRMLPHISRAAIPTVLTIFEESFSAGLSREVPPKATEPERINRLDELLKAFYLGAVHLPKTFRHMITVTEEDAHILRAHQESAAVHTNGIGIDTEKLRRTNDSSPQSESPSVVFLGNYKHPPSVDAARFFAERVLPTLREDFPELRYQIVGAFPTPELVALGEQPGIEVTGFVDDYRPYLWRASAFVAPIFTGSGMRVKVLEAMACGAPLVTTRLALHGIGGKDGEHYLGAETAEDFVRATARLLQQPELGRRLGEAGRRHVEENHSNAARAREREAIWWRIYRDWHARNP